MGAGLFHGKSYSTPINRWFIDVYFMENPR
jgi:hypothetical protein